MEIKKKILIFYKQFKADAVYKTNKKNIKPKYFCLSDKKKSLME